MEKNIRGRLIQKQAAESTGDKQRDKTDGKQHGCGQANVATPQSSQPVKSLDGGGDCNDGRQQGESDGGIGTHATHEHVVSPTP